MLQGYDVVIKLKIYFSTLRAHLHKCGRIRSVQKCIECRLKRFSEINIVCKNDAIKQNKLFLLCSILLGKYYFGLAQNCYLKHATQKNASSKYALQLFCCSVTGCV
jgi:hypothetical protein